MNISFNQFHRDAPGALGWSIGVLKKRYQSFRHDSNTPKLIEIESYHDRLSSFGL